MDKEKRPKETDAIKKKLESYAVLQRKIDNQIERLANFAATMSSASSPNLTGLPMGGGDGSSKTERQVLHKMTMEEKIRGMEQEERQLREELEALIGAMQNPDEQTVIEMRYFDGAKWWSICAALYSAEDDYEENSNKYLKRTFKLHGSALQALARIDRAGKTSK